MGGVGGRGGLRHTDPSRIVEDAMSMAESETEAGAGRVEIRDWSLWTKHVRGAPALVALLEALAEDEVVELVVDGRRGEWVKKKSSASAAPTPGLKPVGRMRDTWFEWFKTRRGDLVSIAPAGDALLLSAADAAGCTALFTEDMSDGARFGRVEIVDPFAPDGLSARAQELLTA